MDKILVDGHDYYVDVVTDSCDYSEHIEVFDVYNDKIGSAVVDHNFEYAYVLYEESEASASYPYYELEAGREGLLKLAEWIVATDPVIS